MTASWDDRAAYCQLCGAPLRWRSVFGADRKACTACDYVQFRSPACAAGAVVARGREVLLVRRAIPPYLGHWGIPAGFQDYWETPEEAAVREVREETGLQVELLRLLDVRYTTDDPRKRVNFVVYFARPVAGELQPADDAAEVRFFSLDALPEQIAFQNNQAILRRLLQEHPKGDLL
jgi:8-oxo-dGTP diphosphatase